MDTYEPIDRPVRMNISLENMTFMFSKEFLPFWKEDISDLYVLLRFLDKGVKLYLPAYLRFPEPLLWFGTLSFSRRFDRKYN